MYKSSHNKWFVFFNFIRQFMPVLQVVFIFWEMTLSKCNMYKTNNWNKLLFYIKSAPPLPHHLPSHVIAKHHHRRESYWQDWYTLSWPHISFSELVKVHSETGFHVKMNASLCKCRLSKDTQVRSNIHSLQAKMEKNTIRTSAKSYKVEQTWKWQIKKTVGNSQSKQKRFS